MTGKPQVFKMGGSWIFQCHHQDERLFSGEFPQVAWRNPWDVCLGAALTHVLEHHAEVEVIEP